MSNDPLATLRAMAQASPEKWGPALAEHERQLRGLPPILDQLMIYTRGVASHIAEGLPIVSEEVGKPRSVIYKTAS